VALCCNVSRSFLSILVVICGSCDLEHGKWTDGCEKCNFPLSSSTAGITESKEMSSVSVSRSEVLRLHVADWNWTCGV